jgi:hypothetical protein
LERKKNMGTQFQRRKVTHEDGLFVGRSAVQVASSAGVLSQSGTAITATAAELNRTLKKATGALSAAADTAGAIFAWQNPEASEVLIELVELIVTTKATGACTVDVGVTTTNATTKIDNLIDGKDINAATGTFDNIVDAGTNGKPRYRCPSGKWITASTASGNVAGTVGTYAIWYIVL